MEKKPIYTYPAIFTPNEDGYCVSFPDWERIIYGGTFGRSLEEAVWMAKDLLGLYCDGAEDGEWAFPPNTPEEPITVPEGSFLLPIVANMAQYRAILEKARRGRYRLRMIDKAWTLKIKSEQRRG